MDRPGAVVSVTSAMLLPKSYWLGTVVFTGPPVADLG